MGWFWGSSANSNGTDDPYSKLDPELREYLEKESPLKYEDTKRESTGASAAAITPSADGPRTSFRKEVGLVTSDEPEAEKPLVPKESLFQDGRYAHLWKTYKPLNELDNAYRTDQERMSDVVAALRTRKAAISRAALENCVEYQIAEKECFTGGVLRRGVDMCKKESRAFNRCFEMQQRFLTALGYLKSDLASAEQEEKIQMHADKLYNEMLERERQDSRQDESYVVGEDGAWARLRQRGQNISETQLLAQFSPEKRKDIKERLDKLNPAERQVEVALIAGEKDAVESYWDAARERLAEQEKHREDRREAGTETMGDTMLRLYRQYTKK